VRSSARRVVSSSGGAVAVPQRTFCCLVLGSFLGREKLAEERLGEVTVRLAWRQFGNSFVLFVNAGG